MKKISASQQRVLDTIISFTLKHGYPPTNRELMELTGYKSISTIHGYLERLKSRGLIKWEHARPRTLTVILPEKESVNS